MEALGEKFGERRRTRMAADEDVLEFDEEAYIVRENTNVVLTRDGWIKRVGRLAVGRRDARRAKATRSSPSCRAARSTTSSSSPTTAPPTRCGSTKCRPRPGYGEPITKFFKLADQVKVDRRGDDRRAVHARRTSRRSGDAPGGPYLLVVTQYGQRAADAAGAVPHRVDEGRPALREARRRRQGRDGAARRRRRPA